MDTMAEDKQQQETLSSGFLGRIGPHRSALLILVLGCLPLAFFAYGDHDGWRVVPVYIAPVLVVIFIWLLLFDMLMNRVMIADKPPAERPRYRLAFRLDIALLLAIVLFWGPFYYAMLKG